jgi:hypothetical protein
VERRALSIFTGLPHVTHIIAVVELPLACRTESADWPAVRANDQLATVC